MGANCFSQAYNHIMVVSVPEQSCILIDVWPGELKTNIVIESMGIQTRENVSMFLLTVIVIETNIGAFGVTEHSLNLTAF